MLRDIEKKLNLLAKSNFGAELQTGLIGIEKESLRVSQDGLIAQTDHPRSLGAALTHSFITTDYSEALLEFVTPPLAGAELAMGFLADIHKYVYPKIIDECLWPASMPCRLNGEQSIRIAEYGSSNLGIMKNVYRRGLGYRYGKIMQVIAGIHVNLSMPKTFWQPWQELMRDVTEQQQFVSQQYFSLIRNLQRIGWLVPYLFGASPAVDRSFSHKDAVELHQWDENTRYAPEATSLRLGDIGYTNHRENEIGVKACYDNLSEYVKCLTRAIETPYAPYEEIGVKVNGDYRQLNANILQIENEYYSTVRPKQVALRREKPTHALLKRGVQYVEIRSLDLNPFAPNGLSLEQLRFLEVLFIYCLLAEDKLIDRREREEIDINEYEVAHFGRRPSLQLRRGGNNISLQQWCEEIFSGLELIAEQMDKAQSNNFYMQAVIEFRPSVTDIDSTLSARLLEAMQKESLSYCDFVTSLEQNYCQRCSNDTLDPHIKLRFDKEAERSVQAQQALEADTQQDFDIFLEQYFAQQIQDEPIYA